MNSNLKGADAAFDTGCDDCNVTLNLILAI